MSLFGKFWKRFRNLRHRQSPDAIRRRRLFAEPLEAHNLLAADLFIDKTTIVNSVIAGQSIDYTIVVRNNGVDDATGVKITDVLPDHTVMDQPVTGPATDQNGIQITVNQPNRLSVGTIEITIPTIHPFDSQSPTPDEYTFTFSLQVDSNAVIVGANNIPNTASVTSENTDEVANMTDGDNSKTASVSVSAQADLQANAKGISTTSINVGQDIQFTIRVDNAGPSDSQNVIVSDDLPTGLSLKSLDSVVNGSNPGQNILGSVWSFDNSLIGGNKFELKATDFPSPLNSNPNAATIIKFTAHADSGTGQPITNTVKIKGQDGVPTTFDPDTSTISDSETSASFTVIPPSLPDLKVTKSTPSGTDNGNAVAGTDLTYSILVENTGIAPTKADSVKLTDVAPTNTVLVDSQTDFVLVSDVDKNGIPVANGVWIFDAGTSSFKKQAAMEIGEKATFSIKLHVPATVPSGASIQNMAKVELTAAGDDENNVDRNTDSATSPVVRQAALTLAKTDAVPPTAANPGSAIPGQQIKYTITVANPNGPSDVTGDSLNDDLSLLPISNISYTSVASGTASGNTGGSGTPVSANKITDTINLPVGGKIVYTVTGTINSSATGSIKNTVTVGTPSGTQNTGDTTKDDIDTLTPQADLDVTKTATKPSVVGGQENITYIITVTNRGVSDAVTLDLTDDVPIGTTLVSFDQTGGSPTWTPDAQNPGNGGTGTIEYTLDRLPPNGSATFTMVVATAGTIVNTDITNNVNVTDTGETSPDPHPNSASVTTQVTPPLAPDLIISKSAPSTAVAGAATKLTYTIRVTNQGNGTADTIKIIEHLPVVNIGKSPTYDAVTPVSGWKFTEPTPGSATGDLIIESTTASLAGNNAFQDFTFTMIVPADASDGATITNSGTGNELTVSTTSVNHPEPDTTNNKAAATTTTIQSRADLFVTKSSTQQSVTVGQNIVYAIKVGTNGPSDAIGVKLSDTIPANTTYVSLTTTDNTWTIEGAEAGGMHPGVVIAKKTGAFLHNSPQVSFTLTVMTNPGLGPNSIINNFATVSSDTQEPNGPNDPNNKSQTVSTTVLVPFDFGDAPIDYENGNPARHSLSSSLHLGTTATDTETSPQSSSDALGDDNLRTAENNFQDDENGVTAPIALLVGRSAVISVISSGVGVLDAWIDFNRNKLFDEAERITPPSGKPVVAGTNTVSFTVPTTAVADIDSAGKLTYARFRLSANGALGPTGVASDGEVEDYTASISKVTPNKVEVISDPENPGLKALSITGTSNADTITVNQRTYPSQVTVSLNGKTSGPYSLGNFLRIIVYAGSGNDKVTINSTRPALIHGELGDDRLIGGANNDEIYGDDGNDYLSGGGGNDILIGGNNNDTLLGGNGRDVLIGGTGIDSLSDNSGDNILIGGSTDNDADHAALQEIMATWSSTRVEDTYLARIGKLGGKIKSSTVHDDTARDTLMSSSTGHDWYLDYLLKDSIVGFNSKVDKKN